MGSGSQTVRLRFVSEAVGTGHTASVQISVAPGARLTLLESLEGSGSAYVANGLIDLEIGEDASVTRIVLVEEPADSVSVCLAEVSLGARASFAQTVLTTGARLQRYETRVMHPGHDASVRMDGAYLLDGTLAPRSLAGSVLHDPQRVARNAVAMARGEPFPILGGGSLTLAASTLCLHGDNPEAFRNAVAVRDALQDAGFRLRGVS